MADTDVMSEGGSDGSDPITNLILRKAEASSRKHAGRSPSPVISPDAKAQAIQATVQREAKPNHSEPTSSALSIPPSTQLPIGVTILQDDAAHNSNQIVQQLLRKPRYFDEDFEAAAMRCNHCGQNGHMARDCRNERKQRPCALCAELGHEIRDCPNRICFKCGQKGHLSRDCRNSGDRQLPRVCPRCGREDCNSAGKADFFRSEGGCNKGYLDSDMRSVRCYVCGRKGHLCCQQGPKLAPRVSCYNCGEEGHWGEQCGRQMTAQVENERRFGSRYNSTSLGANGVGADRRAWAGESGRQREGSWRSGEERGYLSREPQARMVGHALERRWDFLPEPSSTAGYRSSAASAPLFTMGSYSTSRGRSDRRHHHSRR